MQFEGSIKALLERGLERSYEIGPNKVRRGEGALQGARCSVGAGGAATVVAVLEPGLSGLPEVRAWLCTVLHTCIASRAGECVQIQNI